MNDLNDNQKSLLKRCPQWGTFRAGAVRGEGYKHAIGANNGLMGFVRAGLLARFWQDGNVFQMTEAGRALRETLEKVETI